MEQISFFLAKFKSLGLEDGVTKDLFLKEVKNVLKIDLNPKDVVLKDGTMFVKAHPVLKNELFIKKKIFLESLEKVLGPTKVTNLR